MAQRNVIRKNVELNADNVEWFQRHYPQGSLAAMISMLFDKFVEANEKTPQEYAQIAAQELSEDLKRAAS